MDSPKSPMKTEENGLRVSSEGEPNSSQRESSHFADNQELARMGKKQVLKRNFGFMSILGFSCTVLITWEGSTILFVQGLTNGGTAGVIYSFIVVWLSNFSLFSTLCELVSMAPTSGGQYHWVAMLAPRSCAKFLSYLTGWLAVLGWQGAVASSSLLAGNMVLAMASLDNPTFSPQQWQGTLLMWAGLIFVVLINVLISSVLPKFEGFILILHITGFFAILIPLVVLSPHASAKDVFTVFSNGGGFQTQGLSFMVGMMGNVFAFAGTDAAFHMAEETTRPSVVVPQSILLTLLINGSLGFAMMIALVFCMGSIDDAVTSTPGLLGFPHMYIFQQGTGSTAGATVMCAIIYVLTICAVVGMLASTSRVFWSFARDRALPFSQLLSYVHPTTTVPVYAVVVTSVISVLLSLINIGSTVAFNNITGLTITCLYSSYFVAAALLMYRRCTTGFALPNTNATDLPALANTQGAELVWGPFHFKGIFGIINNAYTLCYIVVVIFFSMWPSVLNPTPATMNWDILVTGSALIFAVVYYLLRARHRYNGPIVETQE